MLPRSLIPLLATGMVALPPAAQARMRVNARFPAVVTIGAAVRLPGRVWGGRSERLRLEMRSAARWRAVAWSRRFPLRWRPPRRRAVVRLRVAALRQARVVARSGSARVAVSPTRVLAPAQILSAPEAGAAGGVVRSLGRVDVRRGQYLAADAGTHTPYGLLARVLWVRRDAAVTTLGVERARLTDAVPAGHVTLDLNRSRAKLARLGQRRFSSPYACSGGAAYVDGWFALQLSPAFSLDWSLGGIESVEASAAFRGEAALSAHAGAAAFCSLSATVARWDAPPLRFALGPIPVVIVPRTTLSLEGDAVADVGADVGIRGQIAATAGIRYDGEVHPIAVFDHGLTYSAPAARLSGSISARLVPSVAFLLYGEVGPRFDFSAGLQLDADAQRDPWWTLTAPVELAATLELPGMAELSIPRRTIFSRTFPLAQAAAAGGGEPQPVTRIERARISWDTPATDVDLHVWDEGGNHAWFRQPGGIPGGELSEDDRFGFGPERFFDSSSDRRLTFGLCYFDDNGGRRTAVDVRLTGADGSSHDFARTLAREGDHMLLGGTFTPPEGWCSP